MIQIKNCSKIYEGKVKTYALDNVSLSLPDKGMVFIIGKSGSGKSTLLNIIAGFDKPSKGDISVCKKSLKKLSNKQLDYYRNSTIGFVFQDFCLVEPFTVYQNIRMSFDFMRKWGRKKRIDPILESVGLKGFGRRYPKELSAGQKQRVAIARSLAKNPRIILADEPTGNLDSKTTVQILDLMKDISKDRLVIIVSHNKEDAYKYADRIIELSNGGVLSDKIRNENFEFDEKEGRKEIILPSKGRLSDEQLTYINNKIKDKKGKVNLRKSVEEFIDNEEKISSKKDDISFKTNMGIFKNLKYSFMFFKGHFLSLFLTIFIIVFLTTVLSVSIQFGNYNGKYQYNEVIENINLDGLTIRSTEVNELGEDDIPLYSLPFKDENIYDLANKKKANVYDVCKFPFNFLNTKTVAISLMNTSTLKNGCLTYLDSCVICDEDYIRDLFSDEYGNFILLAGSIKENSDGIIITDFVANSFLHLFPNYNFDSYNSIVNNDFLMKNYGFKVDAIVYTNYLEKYKDLLKDIDQNKTELTVEHSGLFDKLLYEYGVVYSTNPNFRDVYSKNLVNANMNAIYLRSVSFVSDEYEYDSGTTLLTFANLKEDSIWLTYGLYNNLFGTSISANDKSEFVSRDVHIKINDGNGGVVLDKVFKITNVYQTSVKGIYISKSYQKEIIDKSIFISAVKVVGEDLDDIVTYSLNNGLYVCSSRIGIVTKAIDVIRVFSKLFDLLFIIMIVAIAILIIINAMNLINKNIYNIGICRSMGAHIGEIGIIYGVQMIVFGVLIIGLSLLADYFTTNAINYLIVNNISKFLSVPGVSEITYIYFNPLITNYCSGVIVTLIIITIIMPIIIVRKKNPVDIIKSRK